MRGPGSADRLAEGLLLRHGLPLAVPVDVVGLAAAMGVKEVRAATLVEDGRLDGGPLDMTITVRAGEPRQRTRFTIAHELGHVVAATGCRSTDRRHTAAKIGIERFCDDHAAAVLMPYRWVVGQFSAAPMSLSTVLDLACRADVSLSAALLRLRWVLDWPQALLRWTRGEHRWRLAASIGTPRGGRGQLRSATDTTAVLDGCASNAAGRLATVGLPVRLGGQVTALEMEILARRDVAVALGLVPDPAALQRTARTVSVRHDSNRVRSVPTLMGINGTAGRVIDRPAATSRPIQDLR
jgi:hypothetical protein